MACIYITGILVMYAVVLVCAQLKIAEACQLLERDLELLGASAIEDKLQVGKIVCMMKKF